MSCFWQARKYVVDSMGESYAEGVTLDLEKTWEESDARTPLICLLSTGSDPTDAIVALGKRLKIETRSVSMGQGQGVYARKLLQQSMANVRPRVHSGVGRAAGGRQPCRTHLGIVRSLNLHTTCCLLNRKSTRSVRKAASHVTGQTEALTEDDLGRSSFWNPEISF